MPGAGDDACQAPYGLTAMTLQRNLRNAGLRHYWS